MPTATPIFAQVPISTLFVGTPVETARDTLAVALTAIAVLIGT